MTDRPEAPVRKRRAKAAPVEPDPVAEPAVASTPPAPATTARNVSADADKDLTAQLNIRISLRVRNVLNDAVATHGMTKRSAVEQAILRAYDSGQ